MRVLVFEGLTVTRTTSPTEQITFALHTANDYGTFHRRTSRQTHATGRRE
jgi:hypothetical protein